MTQFQQVDDFREESLALFNLVAELKPAQYDTQTQFKQWTFNDILTHLHVWNLGAGMSLTDEPAFVQFINSAFQSITTGGLRQFENQQLDGLEGPALLKTWYDYVEHMSIDFAEADPRARVKWAGPDMSIRSSVTARLMETWAHGQAIYDALGVRRADADRIRNIAILGVNTFQWTFTNRKMRPPATMPLVSLDAPSGGTWTWGDTDNPDRISGTATAFCQTVTQVRNVADTDLTVTGTNASKWMQIAQCFAGPPVPPPPPGSRFVQQVTGD